MGWKYESAYTLTAATKYWNELGLRVSLGKCDRDERCAQDNDLPVHEHLERLFHSGVLERLGWLVGMQASLSDVLFSVVEECGPLGN